jgi:hypothetical protein
MERKHLLRRGNLVHNGDCHIVVLAASCVTGTGEAVGRSIIMDSLAGNVETESTLEDITVSVEQQRSVVEQRLTMHPPIKTMQTLRAVRKIFRGDENHIPLLMCSQYTPPSP